MHIRKRQTPQNTIVIRENPCPSATRQSAGKMVVKNYTPKPVTAKWMRYRLFACLGMTVPVEYRSPACRRDFERECLALWREHGFHVPCEIPLPEDHRTTDPAIGLEYIDGTRLDAFLAGRNISIEEKYAVIQTLFSEMRARHRLALSETLHRLIHYDANTRNVILISGRPVHIDFEMGHLNESVARSAGRETLKLSLQIVNTLGADHLHTVAGLLSKHYAVTPVLSGIRQGELDRWWMRLHVRRDLRRKARHPGRITKMDIARALAKGL